MKGNIVCGLGSGNNSPKSVAVHVEGNENSTVWLQQGTREGGTLFSGVRSLMRDGWKVGRN